MDRPEHPVDRMRGGPSSNGFADRGWWASVAIVRNRPRRDTLLEALELLGQGFERYDIIVHNGKTLARGLFDRQCDMASLSRLLELSARWSGTRIHVNGLELDPKAAGRLAEQLTCAATDAPCATRNPKRGDAFLGCHMAGIGFLGFTPSKLLKGKRFWFVFMKKEDANRHVLDRAPLGEALSPYAFCPRYPARTQALLRGLPDVIDLDRKADRALWIPARQRVRTRWESRLPELVPRKDILYERWARELARLAAFGAGQTLDRPARDHDPSPLERS